MFLLRQTCQNLLKKKFPGLGKNVGLTHENFNPVKPMDWPSIKIWWVKPIWVKLTNGLDWVEKIMGYAQWTGLGKKIYQFSPNKWTLLSTIKLTQTLQKDLLGTTF